MPKGCISAGKLHMSFLFSGAINTKNHHLFKSDGFIRMNAFNVFYRVIFKLQLTYSFLVEIHLFEDIQQKGQNHY